MERKFTLRLDDFESQCLVDLRDYLKEKTDAATIKAVIKRYKDLNQTQLNTSSELNKARRENEELKRKIRAFKGAFENLTI